MSDLLSYSDETGTNSGGRYFVVAGVTLDGYHTEVRNKLRKAEATSGKSKRDWHGSAPQVRAKYLVECLEIGPLEGRVFFRVHRNIGKSHYFPCTANTLVAAAKHFGIEGRSVKASHEGFTVGGRKKLQTLLRSEGDFEVRSGAFNERPEIRLADSLCGMLAAVHCTGKGDPYERLMRDWFVEV